MQVHYTWQARRNYFDAEMVTRSTERWGRNFGGRDANVRVVVVAAAHPGIHPSFTVAALIGIAESLRASGRECPNATLNGGCFDKAMALCGDCQSQSSPPFPYSPGGGFEFALSCDLRIAEMCE